MKYIALHNDKSCETISYFFSLFEMDSPITAYSFELMHIKVYGLTIELVPWIICSELEEVNTPYMILYFSFYSCQHIPILHHVQ